MCGILAVWNRDGAPLDLTAVRRGLTAMRRRGPDDEGYVLIDSRSGRAVACGGRDTRPDVPLPLLESRAGENFDLALGHRRLAILDHSSAGHQPMSTDDGATWIVFNGMVYNFTELRSRLEGLGHEFRSRTDTEVVLRAYRQWGPACVDHFNGMWAFAIWDGQRRQLFASRDRLGIKPLVYHVGATTVAFGSELKGLTAFSSISREIDEEAVHHYLSLMNVPAPFTIHRSVRKLRPAHSIVVDAQSAAERAYWRLEPRPRAVSAADAIEELNDLLQDSVRRHLVGDVPVGTLLSGGVDSSIVSAVAATTARHAAFPTYTVAVPDDPRYDESAWAARVAAHISSDHHPVTLDSAVLASLPELVELFDEPFAVSSVMGVHLLAREASKRLRILLSGDGGDELFAGYLNRYARVDALWDRTAAHQQALLDEERARASTEWVRWEPESAPRSLSLTDEAGRDACFILHKTILNDAEKRALYTTEWSDRTRGLSTTAWLSSRLPPRRNERLTRWQLQDIQTSLHDEMLTKLDKATMACGVEGRVPLLDHRIVEFAISLPAGLKVAAGEGKWILKQVGERYVPREALYRAKSGFNVPLAQWFRGEWRTFLRDTLSPAALRRAGVLEPTAVARLVAHQEAQPTFATSHMVFTLLCLQMWHEVFRGQGN